MTAAILLVIVVIPSVAGAADRHWSKIVQDYVPKTLDGHEPVFAEDNGTFTVPPNPKQECTLPQTGASLAPIVHDAGEVPQFTVMGGWTCPTVTTTLPSDAFQIGADPSAGTDFLFAAEVDQVIGTTPKMSMASLKTPDGGADGEVTEKTVRVKGLKTKVYSYTYHGTLPGQTTATGFNAVSAEPSPHIFITVTSPQAQAVDPTQILMKVLTAGVRP